MMRLGRAVLYIFLLVIFLVGLVLIFQDGIKPGGILGWILVAISLWVLYRMERWQWV